MQKRPNILPSKWCLHVYSHGGRCVENLLSSWGGAREPKPMTKSTCTGPRKGKCWSMKFWLLGTEVVTLKAGLAISPTQIPVPLELSMKLWAPDSSTAFRGCSHSLLHLALFSHGTLVINLMIQIIQNKIKIHSSTTSTDKVICSQVPGS